jgi:ribosomal protein L34E
MRDQCAACGRPIIAVKPNRPVITLDRVWVHVSRRANRNHVAIPESAIRRDDQ